MSKLFNMSFIEDLFNKLDDSPTEALEDCQKQYGKVEDFHANATHELIGFLCAYGAAIKDSPQLTNELLMHKSWPKRKPKEDDVTLAATRFAMNAWETKTEVYERARIYSKVIDYYLSIDVDPADVPDRLAVTKIAGVLKELAANKKGTTPTGHSTRASSNQLPERTPGAMPKRSETDDRVNSPILLRQGANGLAPVEETDIPERVRDDNDLVLRRRNFDIGDRDVVKLRPSPPSPIQIDEENDIYFTAGRHFIKFSRLKIGEEIMVTLRRGPDDEGRWAFRAISAEVVDEGDDELLQ